MTKARLVQIGSHQAIKLPEGFRIAGDHVYLKPVEHGLLVLRETNEWDSLFHSLAMFTDDFMEQRDQPPTQTRPSLDD